MLINPHIRKPAAEVVSTTGAGDSHNRLMLCECFCHLGRAIQIFILLHIL